MKIKMNQISPSTQLFRFGTPFNTEAVTLNIDASSFCETENLPQFKCEKKTTLIYLHTL